MPAPDRTFARWPASVATDRLALRPIEPDDVATVSRLWTDPEVRRYLGGPVPAEQLRQREQACVGHPGCFCVSRQADDVPVGLIIVEAGVRDGRTEISYSFLPEHWGNGYAREAVAGALSWSLAEAPSTDSAVIAVTQEANTRSRRLLDALGGRLTERFVEFDAPQVLYVLAEREQA